MSLLGRSCRRVLLTSTLVIALATVAGATELTEWDLKFLSEKVGVGLVSLAVLELTPQEKNCLHLLINRFGPEEKLITAVTGFLDDVASNKLIDKKPSTKCPR